MDYQFQKKGKFALLTVNNVYTDLSAAAFQLSDRTWVMPAVWESEMLVFAGLGWKLIRS